MIHDAGMVSTGAGMFSRQLLQLTVKSQRRVSGRPNMGTV